MSNPLAYWPDHGGRHALSVGDVLRAREAAPDDAYALVSVVGIHTVKDTTEAIIAPYGTFGENVSAPIAGTSSLLAHYEVLTEGEIADLVPATAAEDEPAAFATDVTAARAALAAVREEGR